MRNASAVKKPSELINKAVSEPLSSSEKAAIRRALKIEQELIDGVNSDKFKRGAIYKPV